VSAALLCVWGASVQAGSLTPAQQKALNEMHALCQQYGQTYERAAKIRDTGVSAERFLKKMMDDDTVTLERYKELAAIVVYVYEHPSLSPADARMAMERECMQDFIKGLR
jgi:hypothetical protein